MARTKRLYSSRRHHILRLKGNLDSHNFALSYMGMQYWKIHPAKQWSIALLLLLLTGIFSLTLYKTQSAKGRIEIWKVCCTMIGEHPLTGFGFGGFQREYMNYQTHYIQQFPSSDNHRLLNNNRYAFNEFLHITVEQGIIGLFSFLSILILLYIKYVKQHSVLFPCLITYILFSCFHTQMTSSCYFYSLHCY